MTSTLVYVATPYSQYPGGIKKAFDHACTATAELIRRGINAYSPIAHTHPIAIRGKIDPLDHEFWLSFDNAMMNASSELFVIEMAGWEKSKGIAAEIETFTKAKKPVSYLSWPDLELTRIKLAEGGDA